MTPAELGRENDWAGEDQQQLKTTDPSSRETGCYIRIIATAVQLENKITGCESQGAFRRDELIGGVTLTLTYSGGIHFQRLFG
jgi:hypothetical protein